MGEPFDCVVLLSSSGKADLELAVRRNEAWLAPIADLSGSTLPYADHVGRGGAERDVHEAVAALEPFIAAVAALPPAVTDSVELSLLARLAVRDGALKAVHDPGEPTAVRYPAAGLVPDAARIALDLAGAGYLRAAFFDRLHLCPACRSSRLNVREECSRCRSPELAEEAIVHHFRCAEQLPESRFRLGRDLRCPKCARMLTHFGMDYDKPGSVQVCGECGHYSDAPKIGFVCFDCGTHTDAEDMPSRDWHHYELTPLGRQSVDAGRLLGRPQGDGGPAGAEALSSRLVAPAAFAEMIGLLEGVQRRSGRASQAIELKLAATPDPDTPRTRRESLTEKAVEDLVWEMLRPGDVVTACPSGLLVLCPETKPREARRIAARIVGHLRGNLPGDVLQDARVLPSSDARALLPVAAS